MLKGLRNIMTAALVALAFQAVDAEQVVALSGRADIQAQLEVEGLDTLQSRWADAMEQRRVLQVAMNDLGADYERVVTRIDALKRGGVDNLERRELERLLREGRTLAEELGKLQKQVNALDARINSIASEIVARLDVEQARLEFKLVSATIDEQVSIVETLNEIANERARYARPLEQIDRRDLALILEDSDGLEDPGDMLAMADELQDAEAEVRAKLDAVQTQLAELKKRQRLLRRARAFSREESFFEEGDRGQAIVARVNRTERADNTQSSTNNGAPSEESGQGTSDPPTVNEQPTSTPTDDASEPEVVAGAPNGNNATPPAQGADPDGLESDADGADTFNDRGEYQSPDPGFEDSPGSLDQPSEPARDHGDVDNSGGDPFATPQDTIVVDRQADPNVSARNVELGEAQLDARIKSLEKDKKELSIQAKRLEQRAKRLRARAEDAD